MVMSPVTFEGQVHLLEMHTRLISNNAADITYAKLIMRVGNFNQKPSCHVD